MDDTQYGAQSGPFLNFFDLGNKLLMCYAQNFAQERRWVGVFVRGGAQV